MSIKESFRSAWKARFPSEVPPNLDCLDERAGSTFGTAGFGAMNNAPTPLGTIESIDKTAVARSLQKCNENIASLTMQLQKQEFTAHFLWNILHGVTDRAPLQTGLSKPLAVKSSRFGSSKLPPSRPLPSPNLSRSLTTDGVMRVKSIDVVKTPDDEALDSDVPVQDPYSFNISPTTPEFESSAEGGAWTGSALGGQSSARGISSSSVDSLPRMQKSQLDTVSRVDQQSDVSSSNQSSPCSVDFVDSSPVNSDLFKQFQRHLDTSVTHKGPFEKQDRAKPVPAPRVNRGRPPPPGSPRSGNAPSGGSQYRSAEDLSAPGGGEEDRPPSLGPRFSSVRGATPPRLPPEVSLIIDLDKKQIHNVTQSRGLLSPDRPQSDPFPRDSSSRNKPVTRNKPALEGTDRYRQSMRVNIGGEGQGGTEGNNLPDVVKGGLGVEESCEGDGGESPSVIGEIYEEAAPVHREFIEADDASSDDEEPLYFNLQRMQEQAMNRAQTLYASRDEFRAILGDLPPSEEVKVKGEGPVKRKPSPSSINQRPAIDIPAGETKFSLSSESVRSTGSDNIFDGEVSFGWRKRRSILKTVESTDSQSESDELEVQGLPCPDDEVLRLRKFVVRSILDSERSYLGILDILMQYMQTFKNCVGTAQAVIPLADIELIFLKIPQLHKAHKFFLHDLEPKVENWSANQQIAEPFRVLAAEEYRTAPDYLKNYPKAVEAIRRCRVESENFSKFSKEIKVPHMVERPSLEELLHKPVVRFQRNTLVLHDLIKYTPTSHADYDPLQKSLQMAQSFLDQFENVANKDSAENQRYLAKQGLVVEIMGGMRKLRHIFLFNDVIVCAKPKYSRQQRIGFDPKWYIPLKDLSLDDKAYVEEEKRLADSQQQEIELLQKRVSELQVELKAEMKQLRAASDAAQRQWSFHNRSKNVEKIKKKLIEQQAAMIKASPLLLFRVHNRHHNRAYTLLMASDYERSNWRFTIAGLLSRAHTSFNFSSTDLVNLLSSQKDRLIVGLPKISTLESLIDKQDFSLEDEYLFGVLNITIYKLQGLRTTAESYCTVEVDSFGHFFMKAKTKVSTSAREPTWNQDFEIDLEGAQTVRLLCYTMGRDVGSLIGTCALELSKAWLRGDFQEKIISLNDEISLTVSLRYSSRHQTLKRTPTGVKGGLFGTRIKAVTRREGSAIPRIVTACIQEVDTRGMEEVGIYRISGASGEIQKLKTAFEKNTSVGTQLVKEGDINVVTGLLKLYFRELPEALFTDALYPNLINGMSLKDPDAKEKYIVSLLQSLPEPNRTTAVFLMDHLLRVSGMMASNKMTLQNLATVFGPTLLRPAANDAQPQTVEELFCVGTREAMTQSSMLLYFLNLRAKGVVL